MPKRVKSQKVKFLQLQACCTQRTICLVRYMLSPVRLSVTRVDHTKWVEDRIMKFSPYRTPIPLVFVGKFHPEILRGPAEQGRRTREGGENQPFSSFNVNISKTAADTAKVTTNNQ